MGSVGRVGRRNGILDLSSISTKDSDYHQFDSGIDYRDWIKDPENSNFSDPDFYYTHDEEDAIERYTGAGYRWMNKALYNKPWEDIEESNREIITNMDKGLAKFDLKKGIEITRQCDFKVFGAKEDGQKLTMQEIRDYISPSNGVLQNDGFMSFSMDGGGRGVAGTGVVIHLRIPPAKGVGAPVYNVSQHPSEKEFVLGRNAVLHFDEKSMRREDGKIHITAYWLGQASKRTID